MTYEVSVGGKAASLSIGGDSFRYRRENGDVVEHTFSLAAAADGTSSILMDGRSFTVTALGGGEMLVNGRVFQVDVFDPRSLRSRKTAGVSEGRQAIPAPMPGRVVRVLVETGQEVESGQGLIVVEAMKMQNEMKSPKAGRVAEVKTIDGATVSAGDILVVIE
jgi:biotin carboxyl carrier protein